MNSDTSHNMHITDFKLELQQAAITKQKMDQLRNSARGMTTTMDNKQAVPTLDLEKIAPNKKSKSYKGRGSSKVGIKFDKHPFEPDPHD